MRSQVLKAYQSWSVTQTPVILPITVNTIGLFALVFGNRVARSFTGTGGAIVIHLMGAIMFVGGFLVLLGFSRGNAFMEVLGLAISSLGTSIYAIGVIVNIGVADLITGGGFFGVTLVLLSRIFFIFLSARARDGE